jgi:heme oxygenase
MKGELNLAAYTRYLINLAHLYRALEKQTVSQAPFARSAPLWDARLHRSESIASDLTALGISHWEATTAPSDSMMEYITHLDSLAGRSDVRLVAHHYTRYLGDLSGGQAIAALVARHYGASPEQLSFYRFELLDNLVSYKNEYRDKLDALQLSSDDESILVAEVALAFRFNQSVFDDLGRGGVSTVVKSA